MHQPRYCVLLCSTIAVFVRVIGSEGINTNEAVPPDIPQSATSSSQSHCSKDTHTVKFLMEKCLQNFDECVEGFTVENPKSSPGKLVFKKVWVI